MTTTGPVTYDPLIHRLGCKPADPFARHLWLPNYLDAAALPKPPPARVWWIYPSQTGGMFLNDTLGCCVFACFGHALAIWTSDATAGKGTVIVPDSAILGAYEGSTGYTPSNPASDQGATISQGLAWFTVNGIGGRKLSAAAFFLPYHVPMMQTAINLFGVVDIGVSLPRSAQSQIGGVWDVPAGTGPVGDGTPGSWGGHSFCMCGYDANFYYGIPWGGVFQKITPAFMQTYVGESYALISRDFLMRSGKTPSGVNLVQMIADSKLLR